MSGLESLKSLTVKSPSIWGPSNRVPWTDVCMILSTVSSDASRYGRLKYSLEYSQKPHIFRNLLADALKLKWNKIITEKDIYNTVNLALEESLSPAICPKCNGRKQLTVQDKIYKCDVCLGVGTKSMSDAVRARYIFKDIDITDVYRKRYIKYIKYNYFNTLIATTQQWEIELHAAFKKIK
jgi:hypothetical protein